MVGAGYGDDPSIPDEAELWRRIPPWHFYYDENLARWRPKSSAFDDDDGSSPMSVFIATEASGPETALAGHEGYALAAFEARLARECGQAVVRDPLPESPAHAVVVGRKTGSVKRRLARGATWVVPPPTG